MSEYIQVEGHNNLVRDTNSNGIVNYDVSGYSVYMRRVRAREQHGDQIRSAVKEINNLKSELREIKGLIKELVNGS